LIRNIQPGPGIAARAPLTDGRTLQIVVLDDKNSLALWKGNLQGRDRVFLTRAGLVLDGDTLRLSSTNLADLNVAIYPAPSALESAGARLEPVAGDLFQRYDPPLPPVVNYQCTAEPLRPAGPLRIIPLGAIDQPVAAAPLDPDFDQAALWRIKLPPALDLGADPILRFHYTGDVARVTLDGRLVTDDFYNGNSFDIGLRRHAPDVLTGDLRIAILPLRKSAPVYMAATARPDFGSAPSVAALQDVEIVPRYQLRLTAPPLNGAPGKISQR
jgi:hypothetical protein